MATNYPIRTALNNEVWKVVKDIIVPSFNSQIKTFITNSTDIQDSDIINADKLDIKDKTVCVYVATDHGAIEANQLFGRAFTVIVSLRIPYMGENEPESFCLAGNLFLDTVADTFLSGRFNLVPTNSSGKNVLPTGKTFIDVMYRDGIGPLTARDASGQLNYRKFDAYINAFMGLEQNREGQL